MADRRMQFAALAAFAALGIGVAKKRKLLIAAGALPLLGLGCFAYWPNPDGSDWFVDTINGYKSHDPRRVVTSSQALTRAVQAPFRLALTGAP